MITVYTTIKAPLAQVWEYWTNPAHITNWNFASIEWHCPKATNDLTVGGSFNWRMEAKDGSMGFDFTGTYNHFIEGEFIAYTISDGRKVEIRFTEIGEEVRFSESFEAEEINPAEMQKAGWQSILDNFKKYVEANLSNE